MVYLRKILINVFVLFSAFHLLINYSLASNYNENKSKRIDFLMDADITSPPCPKNKQKTIYICFGHIKFPDGTEYSGELMNNQFHGIGVLIKVNGEYIEGFWQNNKFIGVYNNNVHSSHYKKHFVNFLSELSNKKLCDKSYLTGRDLFSQGNGFKNFNLDFELMELLRSQEQEKRNLDCKRLYASEWTNDYICLMLDINSKFVNEAKRRGLDCGVNEEKKTFVSSSPKIKKSTTNEELEKAKREAQELRKKLAALEKKQQKQQQTKPKTIIANKPKSEFPLKPIPINFPSVSVKRDDIAVIIGNANYKKQGKDIPNVNPAYADAEGIKQYFMKAKGIKEGNIIFLKDATGSQLLGVFGNKEDYKGQLFNYIKPNKSNVYVYYAGHGVPSGSKGSAYIVPSDANAQTVTFSGYPLSTLYSNLGKLPAKSVTVILEACFSGSSQAGSLFTKSSPITPTAIAPFIPANVKVIAAGSENQMASWEEDSSHSLFTKYFLKAMSGEGDINKDGNVSDDELKDYLSDTMTYFARRYYGRDQKVQIHNGG